MGPLKVLTSTCKFQAANLPFSLPPLEYEKISTHYYVIITFFFSFFFFFFLFEHTPLRFIIFFFSFFFFTFGINQQVHLHVVLWRGVRAVWTRIQYVGPSARQMQRRKSGARPHGPGPGSLAARPRGAHMP